MEGKWLGETVQGSESAEFAYVRKIPFYAVVLKGMDTLSMRFRLCQNCFDPF